MHYEMLKRYVANELKEGIRHKLVLDRFRTIHFRANYHKLRIDSDQRNFEDLTPINIGHSCLAYKFVTVIKMIENKHQCREIH